MKLTVCELSDNPKQLEKDWEKLGAHCHSHATDLLLLPEMPFYPWLAHQPTVDHAQKIEAEKAHEDWIKRFEELGDVIVAYSKPWNKGERFYNSAFVWSQGTGHQKVHTKYFFPEEEDFYEDTWFDREPLNFELVEIAGIKIGFLLCTEIWFTQYARKYGQEGIDLLLCPRATGKSSVAQWVRCGQTLSVISGAYCLSANRSGIGKDEFEWGGTGWITQPGDGTLLGTTSEDSPFLTLEIDLVKSKEAKKGYPLNVRE